VARHTSGARHRGSDAARSARARWLLAATTATCAVVGIMLAGPALLDDDDDPAMQAIELGPDRPECPSAGESCTLVPRSGSPAATASTQPPKARPLTPATQPPKARRLTPATATVAQTPPRPSRRPVTQAKTRTGTPARAVQPPAVVRVRAGSAFVVRFQGTVTITNPGPAAIDPWLLSFVYQGARITSTSGAEGSYDGDRFRATGNRRIAAGGSVSFTFEATGDPKSQPSGCRLNGGACRFR